MKTHKPKKHIKEKTSRAKTKNKENPVEKTRNKNFK